jgi:hypothetical protein
MSRCTLFFQARIGGMSSSLFFRSPPKKHYPAIPEERQVYVKKSRICIKVLSRFFGSKGVLKEKGDQAS